MAQLPNSTTGEDCPAPPSDAFGVLHGLISFCLESGIHLWVQLTGRLVRKSEAPWLAGPLGGRERIGTGIYERVAKAECLLIRTPPDAGLLEHFNVLRGPNFNPGAVHPNIRHFYEHAAEYQLDVWSEVSLVGRFFLWLLVEFIGPGNLRRSVLGNTNAGRDRPLREGYISVPRQRECLSHSGGARGWFVWFGLFRFGVWAHRLLSYD